MVLLLKEHPKYPKMYYYRTTPKGRWSKDFYNLTRAKYYSITTDTIEYTIVGRIPYDQLRSTLT